MRKHLLPCVLMAALPLAGCGSEDGACDPFAQSGCADGLVCEEVEGGEPACFEPVVVRGIVMELPGEEPIADARVVARDVNGAPASAVAISAADGSYEIRVPSARDEGGVPIGLELTLRADAAGYQSFPSGLRQALPIDTADAVADDDGRYVLASTVTDLGLLPDEAAGTGSIAGDVEIAPDHGGVLVVAEDAAGLGFTAIADITGDYRVFNVPAGDYTVTAYARGVTYVPVDVQVSGEATADLALGDAATGTVEGTVQIVNAPGGSVTSVILAVEATFDDVLARGAVPPGLRAPGAGATPDITGEYAIDGVPPGHYVVLAAFENDRLVRDPDLSIGGTSILHIEVVPGETTVVGGFKVTEALEVLEPGAGGVQVISGAPVFSWRDDSSEDEYRVELIDSFGDIIWDTSIAGTSGSDPLVTYDGDALQSGYFYQFRTTSFKDGVPITRTEDLEGVFVVQ